MVALLQHRYGYRMGDELVVYEDPEGKHDEQSWARQHRKFWSFSWKIITDGFLAEQDLEIRLKRSVFGTNGLTLNATIAPVLLATTCAALMAQPTHSDDVVEHPEGLKARCRSKLCLGPAVSE
jgi:hypothetical protein